MVKMGIVNHTNHTTQEKSLQHFCTRFHKALGNMDIPDDTFLYTIHFEPHFHYYSYFFASLH